MDPENTCAELFKQEFVVQTSLEGVCLKGATREALRHFIAEPHCMEDVVEVHLDLDGGGPRLMKDATLPATWAVIISSRAADGTWAFLGYVAGEVKCEAGDRDWIGADKPTSMTAEISVQAFAALLVLS